ncbi:hypothetical protein CCH79_00017802 [Gambusia affinis]|uniref:U6 snRNA-associated Sm-like protein LSm8 n=2 Tax=Poeciliinae TaxID=586240 RepID=A0A315VEK9_GAMAF|nr:hypothetical protein CCH79_00017802 [Gambusia affinis]
MLVLVVVRTAASGLHCSKTLILVSVTKPGSKRAKATESEIAGPNRLKYRQRTEMSVHSKWTSTGHICAKMFVSLTAAASGTVAIVTSDGRMIVGTLKGFDQTINLILDESHERVFSSTQGVEQVVLGLYIVRGDNVAVIGEIDEETDSTLDLGNIRAEPLNSVVH